MRILFLTRLYYPHVGGVEKHLYEVTKRLKNKKIEIKIITTKYENTLKSREKKSGAEIVRFKQPGIKYLGLFYTWFWFCRNIDLINKSDIIHCHDIFIWYLPFRFLFPKKPVYTTFHGRWGKYPIPLVDIIQKRIGAELSKGIISIGEYIPKNYGYKSNLTLYGATNTPSKLFEKKENLIIYVGRLDKDIALDIVLEAFSELRGHEIKFVGDGELRKECEKYGKVYGFTDPSPFYKKAELCFASGYLTIHEALASKCLVFTAYSNPLQKDYYMLAPFSKYIICSDKSEDLLRKFRYYQSSPKVAQKLVDEAYEWVKGQTWEKVTEQYLKLWGVK